MKFMIVLLALGFAAPLLADDKALAPHEKQMLDLTNAHRARSGLPALATAPWCKPAPASIASGCSATA